MTDIIHRACQKTRLIAHRALNATWTYVVLASVVTGTGLVLALAGIRELRTPNYGFRGTHYDFVAFYTAGQAVSGGNSKQLYDASFLTGLQRQIIPHPIGASGYMPFLNPPFVAVALAPLSYLGMTAARLLWLSISIAVAAFILFGLTRGLDRRQRLGTTTLLLLTFPMYQTFIEGQMSILVLLGGYLGYEFWRQKRLKLSGLGLVLLWAIPQFAVFTAIGLVVRKEWRLLKHWTVATLAVMVATLPITGLGIYLHYPQVLIDTTHNHFLNMATSAQLTWRGAINLTMGLNGFFGSLIGERFTLLNNALYITSSVLLVVLVLVVAIRANRKLGHQTKAYLFIAALLVSLLIDPHLFSQDIIVLYVILPVLFSLLPKYRLQSVVGLAVVATFVLLDQYSRVHFFTLSILLISLSALLKSWRTVSERGRGKMI